MPITITYNSTSILNNVDNLAMSVSTSLTQYKSDEYIESIISLTVLFNVTLNRTMFECYISDLDSKMIDVFLNSTGNVHIIEVVV